MLRDRTRNVLHDHLSAGEDDAGRHAQFIQPDCADLPYFLRAYFAWKLGLPFGYSECSRGDGGSSGNGGASPCPRLDPRHGFDVRHGQATGTCDSKIVA